jgi:hypothetical protein
MKIKRFAGVGAIMAAILIASLMAVAQELNYGIPGTAQRLVNDATLADTLAYTTQSVPFYEKSGNSVKLRTETRVVKGIYVQAAYPFLVKLTTPIGTDAAWVPVDTVDVFPNLGTGGDRPCWAYFACPGLTRIIAGGLATSPAETVYVTAYY